MSNNRALIKVPVVATLAASAVALARPVSSATKGLRRAMGVRPSAIDTPQLADSPQFHDGSFHNRLPSDVVATGNQGSMAVDFARKGDRGRPAREVPVVTPELPQTASDLAATWMGHATVLIEIAGHWVLVDPVWSDRVSPSPTVGPRRSHATPMDLEDLPRLSAVLISHDHYDHLDTATIDALTEQQAVTFVVPLGIGAHLRRWGVPSGRIVELDWDQAHTLSLPGAPELPDLTLTCTEARHFSGRGFTRNNTLWSSWAISTGAGSDRRAVFFGGDSGYTPAFVDIGKMYGPFDLTVLPIGAYDERWSDIHMNPAEAIQTHLDVFGGVLLPVHWATFDLAFHTWSAPVDWLVEEAAERDVMVAVPRPGERFDVTGTLPRADWWSAVAGRSAAESRHGRCAS